MRSHLSHTNLKILLIAVCFTFSIFCGGAAWAEKHQVEISGLWAGTNPYSIAVAWAKMINDKSQIVEAVAREGRGPNVDMKSLIKDPAKRKSVVFFQVEDSVWAAKQGYAGWKAFEGKYDFDNFRHIALIGFTTDVLMTTNPDIKTMKDLDGKKVVISNVSGTSAKAVGFEETFTLGGVKPKYEYLGMKAMVESLRDGLIDVAHGGVNVIGPGEYSASPYLRELFATKNVYCVSLDRKAVEAMKAKTGHPCEITTIPPKSVNEYQTQPVVALGKYMTWGCDVSVPDEVVKEILSIYLENIDKFAEITPGGKLLNKKTIAAMGLPENRYHPAAVQFYKDNGIEMTSLQKLGVID